MHRLIRLIVLLSILVVGSVGLVQDQAEEESDGIGTAIVGTSGTNDLGAFLVDGEQMTLYAFTQDRSGVSFCYHSCAEDYPPLLTEGEPQAEGDADAALLGTLQRADGTTQVTYNDHPLYTYAEDTVPNDTIGHLTEAFRGQFLVVAPEGDLKSVEQQADEGEANVDDAEEDSLLAMGENIFLSKCQVCHGNTAPTMEGNTDLADANYVITTILNGRAGGAMPAWRDQLNNEQIAAVASYIRTVGRNEFGLISPESVAGIRGH